jgi:hypothetical protein
MAIFKILLNAIVFQPQNVLLPLPLALELKFGIQISVNV